MTETKPEWLIKSEIVRKCGFNLQIFVTPSAIMLTVVMLGVVILNVMAPVTFNNFILF